LQISAGTATLAEWFSHETWKSVADFVSDWKTITTSIVGVGAAVATFLGWFATLFRWLASKFCRAKPVAPSVAPIIDGRLRFVVDDDSTFHTPVGSDEKTGTHVIGFWDVTNVSDKDVVLLKVRLRGYTSRTASIAVQNSRGYDMMNSLEANNRMSRVRTDLTFAPAIHIPGKDLIVDVIFTDNLADEHLVQSIRFRYQRYVDL
jgi:hypothetical protein